MNSQHFFFEFDGVFSYSQEGIPIIQLGFLKKEDSQNVEYWKMQRDGADIYNFDGSGGFLILLNEKAASEFEFYCSLYSYFSLTKPCISLI